MTSYTLLQGLCFARTQTYYSRVRRKRCDAKRPACVRCTSTGRTCDFLSTDSRVLQGTCSSNVRNVLADHTPKLAVPYLAPILISSNDVPHFDYFRISCTEEFSRSFNATLWKQLILQAAYIEPFMLHAVLSIGAIRRSQLDPLSSASTSAVLQYSKERYKEATMKLANLLKAKRVHMDWKLALLGSLVFLAVEVLRGHEHAALLHFRSGSDILKSLSFDETLLPPRMLHLSQGEEFDDVVTAFTRLSVEQIPFVGLSSNSDAISILPPHFDALGIARSSLNSIVASLDTFLRKYGHPYCKALPSHPLPPPIQIRQFNLQNTLHSWLQKLNNFLCSPASTPDINDHAKILLIQHLVAWIRISSHFFTSQLIYDAYLPEFEQIVDMTEAVVDGNSENPPEAKGPCYTLDIAMAQPLYFVARYCRGGILRRRAIEVLRRVGGDGVYTGRSVAKIAEWIVQAEEGELKDDFVGESTRLSNVMFNICETGKTADVFAVRGSLGECWEKVQGEIDLS